MRVPNLFNASIARARSAIIWMSETIGRLGETENNREEEEGSVNSLGNYTATYTGARGESAGNERNGTKFLEFSMTGPRINLRDVARDVGKFARRCKIRVMKYSLFKRGCKSPRRESNARGARAHRRGGDTC